MILGSRYMRRERGHSIFLHVTTCRAIRRRSAVKLDLSLIGHSVSILFEISVFVLFANVAELRYKNLGRQKKNGQSNENPSRSDTLHQASSSCLIIDVSLTRRVSRYSTCPIYTTKIACMLFLVPDTTSRKFLISLSLLFHYFFFFFFFSLFLFFLLFSFFVQYFS